MLSSYLHSACHREYNDVRSGVERVRAHGELGIKILFSHFVAKVIGPPEALLHLATCGVRR
jgi:hypothetical protein